MIQWDETQVEYYMRECFELAKGALGRTSPNPIVGAIVLDREGHVVGKGFHSKAGLEHAEVMALNEAGEKSKDGTIIVNLEPCSHHGKTPPCVDLILERGIKTVIFSTHDLNTKVHGEKLLLEKNVNVISGVLKKEGEELNKFFLKWIKTKTPWVTLKQAQSLDGMVGQKGKGKGKVAISSKESIKLVHGLRNQYDSILVGANTVRVDDPLLTVRGIEDGRNPVRIVLDKNLSLDPKYNVFNDEARTILFIGECVEEKMISGFKEHREKVEIIRSKVEKDQLDLDNILKKLGELNILSVLVEAGPSLATALLSAHMVNEYILFTCPLLLGQNNGISALEMETNLGEYSSYKIRLHNYKAIGKDLMSTYKLCN